MTDHTQATRGPKPESDEPLSNSKIMIIAWIYLAVLVLGVYLGEHVTIGWRP